MTEILSVINDENSIWYISGYAQSLVQLSLDDFSLQQRMPINNVAYRIVPFSDGIIYQDQMIWAPWNMLGILFFEISTSKFHFIKIEDTESSAHFCHRILLKKDKVFLIPFYYHALIEIDLKDRTISYHKEPIKLIKAMNHKTECYFKDAEWINEDILLLPFYNGNSIVSYNINTRQVFAYNIESEDIRLQKCICSENRIYILPRNENRIYIYDLEFKKIKIINLGTYSRKNYDENSQLADAYFADMIDCEEYLLVVQCQWNYSYIVDKKTYKVNCIELSIPFNGNHKEMWNVKKISKEYIILCGLYDNKWIGKFHIKSKKTNWYRLPKALNNIFYQYPNWKKVIYEEENSNLQDYIEEILKLE